jgi:hypothetical protein
LNVGPGTVVDRLLLAPVSGGVGVSVEVRGYHVVRKRRELFDSRNGNVVDTSLLSFGE